MITIQHATTRYTVTEANAAKYRAIIDSGKLPKIKSPQSTPIRRDYPAFVPGMSTSDYVHLFNRQFDGVQARVQHDCPRYHMPAPMLDAQWPEVVEEVDPDYIAPPPVVKARKATPAQIRAAALELIQALEGMAIHPSHYAKLREMLQ